MTYILETNIMNKSSISAALDVVLNNFLIVQKDITQISGLYETVIREVEATLIKKILTITYRNKKQTAKILGISRNTLTSKIKSLSLEEE